MLGISRQVREAAGNFLFKALSSPLEKACRLLLGLVAARVLGAAAFGTYQFASTATGMLSNCTELGVTIWTTRAIARDNRQAASIVAAGLRSRIASVAPYLLLLVPVALSERAGAPRGAIVLFGIATIAASFGDYVAAVLRGLEEFRRESVTNGLRAILITASALATLRIASSLTGLASGILIGSLAGTAASIWLLWGPYRGARIRTATSARPHGPSTAFAWGEAIPLWLAGLFSTLYFKCDIILLRMLAGAGEVGYYGAAYRVFEAATLLPSVLITISFPALARARDPVGPWSRLEVRLAASLTGVGVLLAPCLYVGRDLVVRQIYGSAFARAADSLRILACAVPLLFLNYALSWFLVARGRERPYLGIVVLMTIVNVCVNLVTIPRWGGPGAAWATLLSEATMSVCCLAVLGKER